jgi:hypothetical protein
VSVTGPKAVLLALALRLRVTAEWRGAFEMAGVSLDELRAELRRPVRRDPKPQLSGVPWRPYLVPPPG